MSTTTERPPVANKPETGRDPAPSSTEALLAAMVVSATLGGGQEVALTKGQGVRAWKLGSFLGADLRPIVARAFTAPVCTQLKGSGVEQMLLMSPKSPVKGVDFEKLREGNLSDHEWAMMERYELDGRARHLAVTAVNQTGLLPMLKTPRKPGNSAAIYEEEPLTPVAFLEMAGGLQVSDDPLVLPGYYAEDPAGSVEMHLVDIGKKVTVRPVSIPFSFLPAEDTLSASELVAVGDAAWQDKVKSHLLNQGVTDVYFGFGASVADSEVCTTQQAVDQDKVKLHTSPLFARNPLAELAGSARGCVQDILGTRPRWSIARNQQRPFSHV